MRRPQIDPKTLRKHSRIMEERSEPTMVVGPKEQTDYGFFVDGHKGKTFETKFFTVMGQCMTPTWTHPKKVRVVRVVTGAGLLQLFALKDGEVVGEVVDQKMMTQGDEVVLEAGTVYRITAGPAKMEMYVTQDAKYESALRELLPAEIVAQVTQDDLTPINAIDKETKVTMGVDRSMRRSRAQAQIEASRAGRPNSNGIPRQARGQDAGNFFQQAPGSAGINVKPVMNFDADGAG